MKETNKQTKPEDRWVSILKIKNRDRLSSITVRRSVNVLFPTPGPGHWTEEPSVEIKVPKSQVETPSPRRDSHDIVGEEPIEGTDFKVREVYIYMSPSMIPDLCHRSQNVIYSLIH